MNRRIAIKCRFQQGRKSAKIFIDTYTVVPDDATSDYVAAAVRAHLDLYFVDVRWQEESEGKNAKWHSL